ncbi:DMT family transporter [Oceanibium sediminis]|uniref:DMT family transporter n=1 Tax=Oceanibium sediminis TaxID=2026339 RepID=UPI000DD4DAD1|nr:DMT family transporter [Oceanibium sediminis]
MAAAVLIMAVAMAFIPLGDTAGKLLITEHGYAPAQVGWLRFCVGFVLLTPLIWTHRAVWRAALNWRMMLRGLLIALGVLSILTALRTEDIGSVFGAFFVGPIFSYALSVVLLGERVTWPRTVLLVVGFLGVLLVVKPGFGMTPGLAFAALAGIFYGAYLTASRWVAPLAPAPILMWSQLGVSAAVLTPPALAVPMPEAWPLGLLLISAAGSLAGNLLLVVAYGRQGATTLAPFIYFQLIYATVYGVLVFETLPDPVALAGLGLLVASGFGSLALRRAA